MITNRSRVPALLLVLASSAARVLLLLLGVLEKLVGGDAGVEAVGHVVMAFVAQRADDLGSQRLI